MDPLHEEPELDVGMTQDDLDMILARFPDLSDYGIGIDWPVTRANFDQHREDLLESLDDCNRVCKWLKCIDETPHFNHTISSYGLKHVAENEIGYVTNGAFIAAAIFCGFRPRFRRDSVNVWFNMSHKSIRAAEARAKQHA